MIQKSFTIILLSLCLNSFAQEQDSIVYDSNLIGEWEYVSFSKANFDATPKDSNKIYLDSAHHWNVFLTMELDSAEEIMIPIDTTRNLPLVKEKCKWKIFVDEDRTWITIPCGSQIRGLHEIIFLSEDELHTLYSMHETLFIIYFRRVEKEKP